LPWLLVKSGFHTPLLEIDTFEYPKDSLSFIYFYTLINGLTGSLAHGPDRLIGQAFTAWYK